MSLWNKRFKGKGWETTQQYANAARSGFCIEALALSTNILKSQLVVALEMEYRKRGKDERKIEKLLKADKDVGDLIKLVRDIDLFSRDQLLSLEEFWQTRNNTLHNYIDGKVEYSQICDAVAGFGKILAFVQGSWLSIQAESVE